MDRKALIEQKKKQLYFKNLMKSMNAITTIEIYESGSERDFYKKVISSYYELWQKSKIEPYSKLTCNSDDIQCYKWIINKAQLTCEKEYIFVNSRYCDGYAKIILNDLSESASQLWCHDWTLNDLQGSLKYGFGKGFCLIDLLDEQVIDIGLVSDDEYNYQLWLWNY
ncbi:hypothetical protein [Clostridium omnivorum]|uniref:Uncharacterized protein n=1 Tax=Clostridium omnivorum TaxID=1604902 RepID=A0ABQ5N7F5_9CLOT|nr:hypothetical protein [Clostridium sp. E14]GLC31185.1 hypothetical protein bsdE14_25950 [Clostridium sp. E14]